MAGTTPPVHCPALVLATRNLVSRHGCRQHHLCHTCCTTYGGSTCAPHIGLGRHVWCSLYTTVSSLIPLCITLPSLLYHSVLTCTVQRSLICSKLWTSLPVKVPSHHDSESIERRDVLAMAPRPRAEISQQMVQCLGKLVSSAFGIHALHFSLADLQEIAIPGATLKSTSQVHHGNQHSYSIVARGCLGP